MSLGGARQAAARGTLRSRRPASLLAVAVLVPLLSACAGVHFHDAAKERTAQEVKTAYDQAALLNVITTERSNRQALLETELKVVNRAVMVVRDFELFRLADSRRPLSESFLGALHARHEQLGTTGANARHQLAAWLSATAQAERQLVQERGAFQTLLRVAPPACEPGLPGDMPAELANRIARVKPEDTPAFKDAAVRYMAATRIYYPRYQQACEKSLATPPAIENLGNGVVRLAYSEWQDARRQLQEARRRSAEAQRRYDDALKASSEAAKELAEAGRDRKIEEKIRDAAGGVEKALAFLETQAGSLGIRVAAEQRLQAIDDLLEAVARGYTPPKSGEPDGDGTATEAQKAQKRADDEKKSRALVVAAAIPSLAGDTWKVILQARSPRVSALLVAKEYQEARRDEAARRVTRDEARVERLRDKFLAVIREVRMLQQVEVALDQARPAFGTACAASERPHGLNELCERGPDVFGLTLGEALGASMDTDVKRSLYRALALYANSIAVARAAQEEADYRLIALDHDQAVDSSEAAIHMWNALIATPVNQLAAYHASGIKPEQLAQLLALLGIAVGVNR